MNTLIAPSTAPGGGISLMSHQQQIHDFLVTHPYAGAWLGVGAGKTLTTLSVLQTVRPIGHILVVAPVAIARSTWLDEIEKWGFPIRTKSLIVDENDKKLDRPVRLARFQEPFTDPPTMYFVNQELLTQPSNPENVLVPTGGTTSPPSSDAAEILQMLQSTGPLTRDDTVEQARIIPALTYRNKPASKKRMLDAIRVLLDAGLIARETQDCRACAGEGCSRCQGGLVDQMPIQIINGQPTIIWPFQTVIIDESQGFKSHTSDRFRALAKVRPAMTRLIELTGTPAPNGLHDLWSQVYLLDQGQTLGHNITAFRKRWFVPKMVPGTTTPAKWIPTPTAEAEIHQAIAHLVMSAQNTSLQLPALTVQDVNVSLPPDLLQAYKDFKRDLVLDIVNEAAMRQAVADYNDWLQNSQDPEAQVIRKHLALLTGDALRASYEKYRDSRLIDFLGDPDIELVSTVVAENQAVLTSKLMQFASGTLYTADPDVPSTKGRYEVIHDKKIEMAEYLVRNNGGEPMLIAYHFRSDLEQLLLRFKAAGVDARAFDGSREMVRQWNAGNIQVMLLHPASAGHGLNLQHGGSSMIWFTLPFSLEHYLQTNGRLYRTGQTKPVTIYRFITKGTQDERLPSLLAGKQQVQDDLINAVALPGEYEAALLSALEDEILEDLNDLWHADRV